MGKAWQGFRSLTPRHSQSVCSDVLANEVIRTVLDENFILWGGDVARMEAHQAAEQPQCKTTGTGWKRREEDGTGWTRRTGYHKS